MTLMKGGNGSSSKGCNRSNEGDCDGNDDRVVVVLVSSDIGWRGAVAARMTIVVFLSMNRFGKKII